MKTVQNKNSKKTPPSISKEKCKELVRLAKKGDKQASDEIVMSHMNLVRSIARNFSKIQGIEREDLVNEGVLGLLTAIQYYDENKGKEFITYAYVCIKNQILLYCMQFQEKTVTETQVIVIRNKLIKDLNREPTAEEIHAEKPQISLKYIKSILSKELYKLSFDRLTEDTFDEFSKTGNSLKDLEYLKTDIDMENKVIKEELFKTLEEIISELKDDEKDLLIRFHGLNGRDRETIKEIAEDYGVRHKSMVVKYYRLIRKIKAIIVKKGYDETILSIFE
jgi:RNA polymerase sigma factor (sigma-70 family)